MLREPDGYLAHKFIVPGSGYTNSLWDWDCWLTNMALREIADDGISEYEKGCVLNFLDHIEQNGRIPIYMTPDRYDVTPYGLTFTNSHKPCLSQHALFIAEKLGFSDKAKDCAEKTVTLFGEDIKKTGVLHEYYDPESGEWVNNPGFQNWNLLSLCMIKWLENN